MKVEVANVQAHVQRLVSVVKMKTVLEGCITKEQRSVLRFSVGKRTQYKEYK
jgi:hypothetical protein